MMGDRAPRVQCGPSESHSEGCLHRFKNLARQHQSMFPTLDIDVEGQLKRLKVNWPTLDQALGEDVGVGQTSPVWRGSCRRRAQKPQAGTTASCQFPWAV